MRRPASKWGHLVAIRAAASLTGHVRLINSVTEDVRQRSLGSVGAHVRYTETNGWNESEVLPEGVRNISRFGRKASLPSMHCGLVSLSLFTTVSLSQMQTIPHKRACANQVKRGRLLPFVRRSCSSIWRRILFE